MKKIYVFTLFMLFLMSFNSLFSQDYEKMFEEYKSKHHFQTVDSLYHYSFTVEAKSTLEPELNKTYTWYLNNAIHVSRGNYSGKLMNGSFVKYSKANNQMIEKGTYLLGVKQGLWYVWNADGTLSSYSEYKKGDLNGEFIEYADSNKCKFSGEFKKNLKSGWWYEYGNDRKVVAKTKYEKGKKDGSAITYDAQGNITKKFNYKEGLLNGKCYLYKEGKKDSTLKYKDGNLVPKKEKKEGLFKRVFHKKNKDNQVEKKKTTQVQKSEKTQKKDNFFKRLFHKKSNSDKKVDDSKSKNQKKDKKGKSQK